MKATAKGKTLADFRAQHDPDVVVPNKIKAALASLAKEGAEAWDYEMDFMKRAGISTTQVGAFREQFSDHVVEARTVGGKSPRKVWFADPKVAAKARG
jgi:hypothetical protein